MGASDDGMPAGGSQHPHRSGAANVLLLAPDGTPADADACQDLLSDVDANSKNVLSLGYSTPPNGTARAVQSDSSPGETTFVCIGERTRSAAASTAGAGTPMPGAATIQVVPDPTDLARIGVVVNECLEEWADGTSPTVVCYHSLSSLLEDVDLQTAFRFLHVLTGRIRAADAFAHYHLDPEAHDDQTVRTISMLFDDVVSVEE